MWGLYGALLAKGQIVYANATYDNKDFIAIYPEIYHGNQAEAETVVRYILNRPGVMAKGGVPGPKEFDESDKIFVFSKIYDTFGVDDDHLLFLPILNLHLFKDQKKKRTEKCVFIGKGQEFYLKELIGLRRLDRALITNQAALADYLNTCEVMYSFENPTAMNELARLCGCRVVFIPEGSMTEYPKESLEKNYEPGMMGISWGLKDHQPLDVKAFRRHYIGLREAFDKKLDRFIELTQL